MISNNMVHVAELAARKKLPIKFLTDLGVCDVPLGIAIAYHLEDGTLAPRQRLRVAFSSKNGFRWVSRGGGSYHDTKSVAKTPPGPSLEAAGLCQPTAKKPEIVPYGLWRPISYAKKYVILVEGESDCWSLWYHGFPTLGLPGASTAKLLKPSYLVGLENIYIWQEPGEAGEGFVTGLAKQLHEIGYRGKARVIRMDGIKDPSELHIQDDKTFPRTMRYLMALAQPVKPYIPPTPKSKPRIAATGKLDADKIKRASDYPLAKLIQPQNGKILCPFHKDTRPSMVVNDKYPFGKCFACGKTMNSITYLTKFEGMKFAEAVNYLCGKFI